MQEIVDPRQRRGLEIAAMAKLTRRGAVWRVPSQSGAGVAYEVSPDAETCTCPDHETRGVKCKHQWAVEIVISRERHADGSETVTKSMTVKQTVRRTYPQVWSAYNRAQTTEKAQFQVLLRELVQDIKEPTRSRNGRPRLPVEDAIFAMVYKIYSTVSARRFMTDLKEAHEKGHISQLPHYNTMLSRFEDKNITPILRDLITKNSLPLKAIEVDFAVDSSGFSTSRFHRWFDEKHGELRQQSDWIKVHLMVGVRTNVVTAIEIKDRHAADT